MEAKMNRKEQRAAEFNDAGTQLKDKITSKYAEMTGYVKERDRTRRRNICRRWFRPTCQLGTIG
jgi:hypothetical protein